MDKEQYEEWKALLLDSIDGGPSDILALELIESLRAAATAAQVLFDAVIERPLFAPDDDEQEKLINIAQALEALPAWVLESDETP